MYRHVPKTLLSSIYCRQIRYKYSRRQIKNPGIDKRLKIFDNDIEFDDDDELNCELDVDNTTSPGLTRKQELHRQQDRLRKIITVQKYFHINQPNFLTWQEKEQIRYLHQTDPEEWSVEKLSDSFPALPDTIKKILSSQWKPKSEQRILNHDRKVTENWLKLQNNQFDLNETLRTHLNKFMNRKTVNTILESDIRKSSNYEQDRKTPSTKTEFLDIVKDCTSKDKENNTKLITDNIVNVPDVHRNVGTSNKPNMKAVESKFSNLTVDISSKEFVPSQQGYAEIIDIPKKLWIKGKTYRVADCYYDDDGEFLYRVPGMVK